ncbi:MAG: LacI family DNA-binding transcriptional regulator [Alphaproteobacteria bacterium]|nr:LacI family DNA-binding transcriptional regulator [Alphaproteobacteria bacterium]
MAVTLKDVAKKAGVSRSAVSRTFTEGASVSDKMRKKVEKAAKELGYYPNIIASSLTTRRTKIIGLVSDNFVNPFFLEAFDLFTSGLQRNDLRPMLFNMTENQDISFTVEKLKQYSVDGVIVASSTIADGLVNLFLEAKIPAVYAFARYTGQANVNVVGIDNVFAGKFAAQTLISRGYKKLGFLGGPQNSRSTQDRFEGFKSEIQNHPELELSFSYSDSYSFQAGRSAMTKAIKKHASEAYFCADDVISIGAISAIQDAGLNVPKDIGILGLNDMEIAGWGNINLTTIHQPIREIVSSAIDLMANTLEDPDKYPETRLFPCRLVERGTLRPPK